MRVLILAAAMLVCAVSPAVPREGPQWAQMATPENVKQWYRDLKQPDNPFQSCCGESDAYHADSFRSTTDAATGETFYVAIVADDRDDAALGRPHIDVGTEFVVPNTKLKFDAGNPTGHGVIFIATDGRVLCYIAPGGV